jgi:hypothetical protein
VAYSLGGPVALFDANPISAQAPQSFVNDEPATSNDLVRAPKIRKEFPETWIWNTIDDIGLVIFLTVLVSGRMQSIINYYSIVLYVLVAINSAVSS